jgi:hypothetical protein
VTLRMTVFHCRLEQSVVLCVPVWRMGLVCVVSDVVLSVVVCQGGRACVVAVLLRVLAW